MTARIVASAWIALVAVAACSDGGHDGGTGGTLTSAPTVSSGTSEITVSATTSPASSTSAPDSSVPDSSVPAARTAFTLPAGFEYPEGIAYDPETGRVYISSPNSGGAIAVAGPGATEASIWLPAGEEGRVATLGIEFGHGSVWVVDSFSVLLEYGPDGTLRSSHPTKKGLNDVTVGLDGVYASGPDAAIYFLPFDAADGSEMQLIDLAAAAPELTGQGFNGIEALPDGTLIAGQFACCSLYHIDPRMPSARAVDLGGYTFVTSDGMSLLGDYDLWITNGFSRDSVDRVHLCPSYDCGTVTSGAVDPNLSFPTDVQVIEGAVLVVNSQFDNGGGLGNGTPTKPFSISVLPLAASS